MLWWLIMPNLFVTWQRCILNSPVPCNTIYDCFPVNGTVTLSKVYPSVPPLGHAPRSSNLDTY